MCVYAQFTRVGRAQVFHQAIVLSPQVLNPRLVKTGMTTGKARVWLERRSVVPTPASNQMLYDSILWGLVAIAKK